MYDAYPSSTLKSLLDRQDHRLIRLHFPKNDGPDDLLLPEYFEATENVSRDFKYTIKLLAENAHIQSKDLIGKLVTIELARKCGSSRYFNGYVFEFKHLGTDGGFALYEMVLGPWLAFLKLRKDNYLFHDQSILDQTALVFSDYLMHDYDARIDGPDAPLTLAVQWDESDYNYLHRRWESRGWHYWYEHRYDGHTLVLSDDSSLANAVDADPQVRYHQDESGEVNDSLHSWTSIRHLSPTRYSATAFDFKNPHPQSTSIVTLNEQGDVPSLEVYEYAGAYGFKQGDSGEQLVRRRIEEIETQAKFFEGRGDCLRLQPGRSFEIVEHYEHDKDKPEDRHFFITTMQHRARNNYLNKGQASSYENALTCSRKKIPWRPGRDFNSSTPIVHGLMTALVVGPGGEEIYCDEYGRVRIQFHFDREGHYNERSSCWVRVASSSAGGQFGFVSIPRIGQEVIVQFLGGDPDMPLVTGLVYNTDHMPPWELPANKTQTGFLTRSTGGGSYANANALRFEDKQGAEQLWIHAERNQDIEVENDETHWVGQDRTKTIDRDETTHIKRDRSETVDRDETITIHNDRTERVDSNETISIGNDRTEDVGRNESVSIGVSRTEVIGKNSTSQIGDNASIAIGKNLSQNVGASSQSTTRKNDTVNVGRNQKITVGMMKTETIGGASMLNVGMVYNRNIGGMMFSVVGASRIDQVGQSLSVTAGNRIAFKVGDSQIVITPDAIHLESTAIHIKAKTNVHVDGPDDIHLNSGTAESPPEDQSMAESVSMKGGGIPKLGGLGGLGGGWAG